MSPIQSCHQHDFYDLLDAEDIEPNVLQINELASLGYFWECGLEDIAGVLTSEPSPKDTGMMDPKDEEAQEQEEEEDEEERGQGYLLLYFSYK
jgi:hypothetical protein